MADAEWDAVEKYVRSRQLTRNDVYGWARLIEENDPTALILTSGDAPENSFPETIGRIRIVLKRIPPPVRYGC
jgi:hypothetical protein